MPYSGLRARVEERERHEQLREAESRQAQRELEMFVDLDVQIRDVVKPSFPAALKREISENEIPEKCIKKGTEESTENSQELRLSDAADLCRPEPCTTINKFDLQIFKIQNFAADRKRLDLRLEGIDATGRHRPGLATRRSARSRLPQIAS